MALLGIRTPAARTPQAAHRLRVAVVFLLALAAVVLLTGAVSGRPAGARPPSGPPQPVPGAAAVAAEAGSAWRLAAG